jgi:hypothetical protein
MVAQELTAPLDVLAAKGGQAHGPAEGVILTHEQAWRNKGVTLGRLLHSMTLAPGEVTQIAVTGWHRDTKGETQEDIAERERAAQAAGRHREIHDVTTGVATEAQFGQSTASASSTENDGGVGGVLGFLGGVASSSVNTAFASTVGFNTGARSVSADSNEAVKQSTQQHAANARGRRAALVQEVSESETEQFQTRVVANYNHTHSLNVMYYEVLQVYELSTVVTDAQRCLFLPMQPMSFKAETVLAYAKQLARAARAMGRSGLAAAIEQVDQDRQRTLGLIRVATQNANDLQRELTGDISALSQMLVQIANDNAKRDSLREEKIKLQQDASSAENVMKKSQSTFAEVPRLTEIVFEDAGLVLKIRGQNDRIATL